MTVHAHGVYFFKDEPGKKFWSTKDAGQQPLKYTAGAGEVIVGWDQGCLGMRVSTRQGAPSPPPCIAALQRDAASWSPAFDPTRSRLAGAGGAVYRRTFA